MSSAPTDLDDLPPPPKGVRLAQIEDAAASLRHVLRRREGVCMDTDTAIEVTRELRKSGLDKCPQNAVFDTLVQYVGVDVDAAFVDQVASQLAGRYTELRSGPVSLYERPMYSEWVAVRCVGMQRTRWGTDRLGYLMHLKVLYGHPSGTVLLRKVPANYLRYMAYQVGFGRRVTYDEDPRQFLGLMFWAYFVPKGEEYSIKAYKMNGYMQSVNKDIIRKRCRFDVDLEEDPCPIEAKHPCWTCENVACSAAITRY